VAVPLWHLKPPVLIGAEIPSAASPAGGRGRTEGAGEGGTAVILISFFSWRASCGFPLASGERVTSLCSPEQSFRSAAGRAG